MSLLDRLTARPRLFDEVRFVLSAGLIGALAGLVLAALALPPDSPGFPTSPRLAPWLAAVAPAAGIGWWSALVWAVAMALQARRGGVPIAALTPAAWLAAGITVACGAAAPLLTLDRGWGVAAGVVAGTLAARTWLSRAAGRARA